MPRSADLRRGQRRFVTRSSLNRRRALLERLETRHLLAGDPFEYSIPDSGNSNDIRLIVNESALEVREGEGALLTSEDLTGISEIIINGSSDPDTLVLDYSGGGFGVPIRFDGDMPDLGTGDALHLVGGSATTITHNVEDPSSGSISIDGNGLDHVVSYSGLEPIVDDLGTVDRVFTFLGGAETILLGDDGVLGDGVNRIDSTLGELIDFATPSDSLTINAGTGVDVINIESMDSATVFTSLIVNGDEESDTINVASLAGSIAAEINGGDGSDTINLGTDAGGLSGILGSVEINRMDAMAGGAIGMMPTDVTESVTAKSQTIAVTLPIGDELNFNDSASVMPQTYTLDDSTLTRTGLPAISYAMVDTLTVETGSAADIFNILDTQASTNISVSTFGGADVISVTDSGDDGILRIDSGTENDSVSIDSTGDRSVTLLVTAAGEDDVSVTTTGSDSGLDIRTGTEIDVVTLSGTGAGSSTAVRLGAGDDIANIQTTAALSFTDVFAGSGNDTLNVSSDADGDRTNASGDPAGNLDGILGELCVHGNDNLATPTNSESVTANAETVTVTTIQGDELNIADSASAAANTYTLDLDQFTRSGIAPITYAAIETLQIETGSGNDVVDIVSTRADTRTILNTRGGTANISIGDTGNRSVLLVDTRLDNDIVSVDNTGDDSLLRINTAAGDDDVSVTSTGANSGLDVRSGSNLDVVHLLGSGDNSVAAARLGPGDDIVNVQSAGTASETELFLASGNDVINLSSSADGNRVNPNGTLTGTLDGFLGDVVVRGNSNLLIPDTTESVTAKTETRMVTHVLGDTLNISDQSSSANNTYALAATQLTRNGISPISYVGIETLSVETGSGDDVFDLITTPASSTVTVDTLAGEDAITVSDFGDDSILRIDSGPDNDTVDVVTTGARSVGFLVTGSGDDDVTVTTTGADSGLDIRTGTEIDVVNLLGTGSGSATAIRLGAGDDIANIQSTGATSFTDLFGGSGNDTINVSSDADGDRANTSGDPAGNLDGLLGELCVHGNSNLAAPTSTATVTASGLTVAATVLRGDELNVSDEGNTVAGNYALDLNQLTKTGIAPITYAAIETFNIETGSAADTFDIVSTRASTNVSLSTNAGADVVTVADTGDDGILQLDSGSDNDDVSIGRTGDRSVTLLNTDAGEDDVQVTTTGTDSGLEIQTGSEIDLVTLLATGATSAVDFDLGDGNDIANLRSTATGSFSDIDAGLGSDTVNVSSDADGSRADVSGSPAGNLDGLLGEIVLVGSDHLAAPDVTATATAKALTVSAMLSVGDQLNVSDQGNAAAGMYTLDATELTRVGIAPIGYATFETLVIETGSGGDTFDISATPASTTLVLETNAGADTITVTDSGEDGILQIDSGTDNDIVDVVTTGDRSVTEVVTGSGDDDVTVTTTGADSGLDIRTGTEIDVVNLLGTGSGSATAVRLGAGEDIANIQSTGATSFTDLFGGSGNDTINVSSDADGDRANTSGDPAGNLDGLLGELCVHGNDNLAAPTSTATVTASGLTVAATVLRGDELNVSDEGNTVAGNYTLDLNQLTKTGIASITYAAIETFNIETGSAADSFDIVSTRASTNVNLATNDGEDAISVSDTGDDGIVQINSGADNDSTSVGRTGDRSVLLIETWSGEDDVEITTTGLGAGLDIQTNSGIDLVTIIGTGVDSATTVNLGEEDDIGNIRSTGFGSSLEMVAGLGNDTINVASDADGSRVDLSGDPAGDLNGILGGLSLVGNDHLLVPDVMASATAKGLTISATLAVGDVLNVSDQGNVTDETYTLDATTLTRLGIAPIDYSSFETLNIETGSGSDIFDLLLTPDSTTVRLDTFAGNDTISVIDSGDDSILEIGSGTDNDSLSMTTTGDRSVTLIVTAGGDDDVLVTTTGTDSGVDIRTGTDVDLVSLVGTGTGSATAVRLGAGDDIANVQSTATGSFTDIFGGSGNDTINVSSDADGDRTNASGDPAGNLDGLLGELCVHGNDHLAVPEIVADVTAKALTVSATVSRGDELNVSDEGNAVAGSYTLDLNQLTRVGIAPITYAAIETFNIETGSGADDFDIVSTRANTLVSLATNAGADAISIDDTGDDSIVQIDSGLDNDAVDIDLTGTRSVTQVVTGGGDDDVEIITTGLQSGLEVLTGTGIDVVTLIGTGNDSAVAIGLGDDDDIANIRSTGVGSFTDVFAGTGDDTINVSSDADGDRLNPGGDPAGNLDEILGDLCVFGEDDLAASTTTATAEARQTDGDVASVSTTIDLGDELNISDQASPTNNDYSITATTLQRTGPSATGLVVYSTMETVNVETGGGNDTVEVTSTSDATLLRLETFAGDDTVAVTTTGANSILEIETTTGADDIEIAGTGDLSVLTLMTGSADDMLTLSSVGDGAGIDATTGDGMDTIRLDTEPVPSTRTSNAVISIDSGADQDDFTVEEVYLQSVVDLQGGPGNDEFELIADCSDSGGYLGRLNDDPASDPSDDLIARTRQLFLDGGGNDAATETVIQDATLTPDPVPEPVQGSVAAVPVGDTVRVNASSATDPLDLRYAIAGPGEGVFATTIPGNPRSEVGNEVFETSGIENIDLVSGDADDLLTVSSDIAYDINQTMQTLSFDGGLGTNRFEVVGTANDDEMTIGDLGR